MKHFLITKVNPLESKDALALIRQLDNELGQRYPGEKVNALDLTNFNQDSTVFWVGYLAGQAVACGAVRQLEAHTGEIKRMFVKQEARGLGLAKLILTRLEQEAVAMGFQVLRLETAGRQPEALGLYRQSGYADIPPFGQYAGNPRSICLEKRLI
ncbi:MAG: GNAT family N-acetyltransferase [Anaerolineae bacterium]|nr:GNAT family N-acetyltransferase [Anaerolineae bacterium]